MRHCVLEVVRPLHYHDPPIKYLAFPEAAGLAQPATRDNADPALAGRRHIITLPALSVLIAAWVACVQAGRQRQRQLGERRDPSRQKTISMSWNGLRLPPPPTACRVPNAHGYWN